MDLNADLAAMELPELLERQQELTRHRQQVLAEAHRVQAEVDRRRYELAEQRAAEDAMLGQVTKPPAQQLLGAPDTEVPATDG